MKKALPLLALGLASVFHPAVLASPVPTVCTTIDLSPYANGELAGVINGHTYPTGSQTFGGVPFEIGSSGNNYWNAALASGDNPRQVDVSVGLFGVTEVHTLMSTWWGETGPGTLAAIEFIGTGGAFLHVDLDGNVDIRDYNFNPSYTTLINGTTTTEVFDNGLGQHFDKQAFALPAAFATETLETVRFIDTGADGWQRLFVAGLTVCQDPGDPVPDAGSTALLLGTCSMLLGWMRRKA